MTIVMTMKAVNRKTMDLCGNGLPGAFSSPETAENRPWKAGFPAPHQLLRPWRKPKRAYGNRVFGDAIAGCSEITSGIQAEISLFRGCLLG